MFRQRANGLPVRRCRNVKLELRNPVVEQGTGLLNQPLIKDRAKIAEAIDLRDECAKASICADCSHKILAAEDMWLSNTQRPQFRADVDGNSGIDAHAGYQEIGVSLFGGDQAGDRLEFLIEIAPLKPPARIRGVFALHCRIDRPIRPLYDEDRILTAVLSFPINLHRPSQHFLANLRAEILEGLPADGLESKI